MRHFSGAKKKQATNTYAKMMNHKWILSGEKSQMLLNDFIHATSGKGKVLAENLYR